MERGYIKITENRDNQLFIDVKTVNCTVWITKHEIADLFNVYVSSVSNSLKAIFKSGILHEEDVTWINRYEYNGRQCEMVLYNLEAITFISYRIASFEAKAFREWIMRALTEYLRTKPYKEAEVLVLYNLTSGLPAISLN